MTATPDPRPADGLDDNLGYWVNRLARAMREAVDRDFAAHGVNVAHWAILAACEAPGQHRVIDLARRIGVDPAGTTRLLERLEQAGFVTRLPDPLDRRAQRIALTPAGEALLPRLKAISEAHNRRWSDRLGVPDLARAIRGALDPDGP